ncbi:MAG: transcription antitermination factor NusB [Erysipelotrichales bacterium]
MKEYQLTRRQARQAALIYFYQYLVEEEHAQNEEIFFNLAKFIDNNMKNLNLYLKEDFETDKEIKLVNDELFTLLVRRMNDISTIKDEVSKHLGKSWEFDRLNKVEQALLIISYIEIKANITDRKIIINEAIELAKLYCDDDTYKFINGVLDSINV